MRRLVCENTIEAAKKIAKAQDVSLDYRVGNTDLLLEKNIVNKIVDIQKLGSKDKSHVFAMLDAFLQSHKSKRLAVSNETVSIQVKTEGIMQSMSRKGIA